MPDATECWLVEYVDLDKRTVFDRFANVNEAIPCLHRVLASGQRPRLYRETPITLTIDVGGEAPVKSPRRRRKKEAKEGVASPQAAERDGLRDGLAGESARGVAPHSLSPQPTASYLVGPVFQRCEASFDGDPACPGPVTWDHVTCGWFCGLHLTAIPPSGRVELHRLHGSRNRPVRVAHAG